MNYILDRAGKTGVQTRSQTGEDPDRDPILKYIPIPPPLECWEHESVIVQSCWRVSHIDQGVYRYRNCMFASDRRLRNLRHLLYDMMQRRPKAIADVFPEEVVPWSSLSLGAPHLDGPARQALEACMPHLRKTSTPPVAEPLYPIWPRPAAASMFATAGADVGTFPAERGSVQGGGFSCVARWNRPDLNVERKVARALLEVGGNVEAGRARGGGGGSEAYSQEQWR